MRDFIQSSDVSGDNAAELDQKNDVMQAANTALM
jgi:hypothetical protein